MNLNAALRIPIAIAATLAVAFFAACDAARVGSGSPAASPPLSSTPAPTAMPTPPGTEIVGAPFTAPIEACAGPQPFHGLPAIVVRLGEAWHEHDFAARRAILDQVWAEDGLYQDPYGDPTVGRDAFAAIMGYGVAPGQYLEIRSWDPSDMHHGVIRLQWRHCCPSGITLLEGTDIATLGPDGRLSRIMSFWSHYVEEAAEEACDGPRQSGRPDATGAAVGEGDASCKGPDVNWSGLPPVVQGYGKAWNERDSAARRALLEEVWADAGTYADPTIEDVVTGREAFVEHIGGFLAAGYGAYFQPRPMVEGDFHHGFARMPWVYCDADGKVVWIGEDISELDADGRIVADLGFFAP